MKEALIVNPYSREDMSDAIKRALMMPLPERVARWETLMHGVAVDDVGAWRNDFVHALETVPRRRIHDGSELVRVRDRTQRRPDLGAAAVHVG
jgi:trehalose 6-phosphate synthase